MAKRKPTKKGQLPDYTKEELRAIYDKVRREFTAADLQKYTEIQKGVPARKVLADMEAIHKEETRKRRRA